MSKVYLKKTKTTNFQEISVIARKLLEKLVKENNFQLEEHVPLKVHFGEDGNFTYIPAIAFDGIIDYLESKKIKSSFIETNVLYRGLRTTRSQHIKLALEHGFKRLPIIIADGEMGECYYEVEINKEYFDKCKLGLSHKDFNQYIICSHFKGHPIAGFGGALKQLAMGFSARSGKMAQHSQTQPTVMESKCIACGLCVERCDAKAINMYGKAYIDKRLCVGCALCIAVCFTGAVYHDFSAEHFLEKMSEYALATTLNKKMIYINFVQNITRECDCFSTRMGLLTDNIGVFASLDPVAVDSACLDAVQAQTKSDLFENGRKLLSSSENLGLGTSKYELVEIENTTI